VDLPNHHKRQVPSNYEDSEDQAGKERRATGLQPWEGVDPPARLLPCSAEARNKKNQGENHQEARPATQFDRRGSPSTEHDVKHRRAKSKPDREQEGHGVPPKPHAPAHHAPQQAADPALAVGDGQHEEGR
jgi:hypothetical protein